MCPVCCVLRADPERHWYPDTTHFLLLVLYSVKFSVSLTYVSFPSPHRHSNLARSIYTSSWKKQLLKDFSPSHFLYVTYFWKTALFLKLLLQNFIQPLTAHLIFRFLLNGNDVSLTVLPKIFNLLPFDNLKRSSSLHMPYLFIQNMIKCHAFLVLFRLWCSILYS